jgi:hypothetical protein
MNRLFCTLALTLALLALPAQAAMFRYGVAPTFIVNVPDDWTHDVDPRHDSLGLWSPDHAQGLSLLSGPTAGTLDQMASGAALGATVHRRGRAAISGYRGAVYEGEITNSRGVHVYARMIMVTFDAQRTGEVLMISTSPPGSPAYQAAVTQLNAVTPDPPA